MYGHVKKFGCGKILVVVTFWWGIDFLMWDITFLGAWEFLDMWVLVMEIDKLELLCCRVSRVKVISIC